MNRRVKTVLLLGSRYDAFLMEEAGYVLPGSRVSQLPGDVPAHYVHAQNGRHALDIMANADVDLVLSALRLNREDPFEVASQLRSISPHVPAVLVTSDPAYLGPLSHAPSYAPFDFVFGWTGNTELLRSIALLIEDRLNADHDLIEGVRLILLVEDEVALYSQYAPMVYDEICGHVWDLLRESYPPEEQARRGRARTKLLVAHTYEEALLVLARHGASLCGVLSDLQYPRDGSIDNEAGLHLARHVKMLRESIPVVIQSRERTVKHAAHDAGAFFIWKESDHLLKKLRGVMNDYFGFGDFVFRDPLSEAELARAKNLKDLARHLRDLPETVFHYHGSRFHFSNWLFIHGEYTLAHTFRSIPSTDAMARGKALALIEEAISWSDDATL